MSISIILIRQEAPRGISGGAGVVPIGTHGRPVMSSATSLLFGSPFAGGALPGPFAPIPSVGAAAAPPLLADSRAPTASSAPVVTPGGSGGGQPALQSSASGPSWSAGSADPLGDPLAD